MTILITAGPTREPIDPVRYLTNHSSGKMGYAIAEAAAEKKHRVILISGPTHIDIPDHVDFIQVETAIEMYEAVQDYISKADIAIFTAAVADFRPKQKLEQKLKKSTVAGELSLELVRNPDILGSARSAMNYEGVLIGFAAESEELIENATRKLNQKQCDLVIANDISRKDIGFNSDENEIIFVYPNKIEMPTKASKHHLAHIIIEKALMLLEQTHQHST